MSDATAVMNDPGAPQTATRGPRLRVLTDTGQVLAGAISAEVETNNFYRADHFSLEFAASASATKWWDAEPAMVLDVQVSLDGGTGWQSLCVGEVDDVEWQPDRGLLRLSGRDLSARFIESKTQEAFVNKTASEVAAELAARHFPGLPTNITPTTTLVGRYYEADHVRGTLDQFARTTTEWDLLVYLAQREGFDVFMRGTEFNFVPRLPENSTPFIVRWDRQPNAPIPRLNVTNLRMKRSLTIAKDVEVLVRSWNSAQGRGFTKTARGSGTKPANASGTTAGKPITTQRFSYIKPNLTESEAQQLANQLVIDLTRHERLINFDLPGELTLTPRTMVRLEGTSSSWDQTYWTDSITRSISFGEGFTERVLCKNSSPRSMVQE